MKVQAYGLNLLSDNSSDVKYTGILGLSPIPEPKYGYYSFVYLMKYQGIIQKENFGLYFEDTEYGSEITFGEIDTERVSSIDTFAFIEFNKLEELQINITSMRYGNIELSNRVKYGFLKSYSEIFLPRREQGSFWRGRSKHVRF